jgi:hypothetical protein
LAFSEEPPRTRICACGDDVHTGNLTDHHVAGVVGNTLTQLVRLDGGDGACQVVLLDLAVSDDDHVLQHLVVLLQDEEHAGGCRLFLRLIADERHGDDVSLLGAQAEVAVGSGYRTVGGTLDGYARADNRLARVVLDNAAYGELLR